jgi:hypothetical protein
MTWNVTVMGGFNCSRQLRRTRQAPIWSVHFGGIAPHIPPAPPQPSDPVLSFGFSDFQNPDPAAENLAAN